MVLSRVLAKSLARLVLVVALGSVSARVSSAQIVTGSDGSDGAFVFVPDTPGGSTMTIDLALAATGLDGQGQPITWQTPSPVAGRGVYDPFAWAVVFKYSSVDVPAGKTVRFMNHPSRAPVVWLATTTVYVRGIVDISGPQSYPGLASWPEPGPGGFRGGGFRANGGMRPGFGPGGGDSPTTIEWGNHAGPGTTNHGPLYGSAAAFPLIGGSGASSPDDAIGAPGGGAILIAAGQRIEVLPNGRIRALRGVWLLDEYTAGSGGSVRLVSDVIALPAAVSVDAFNSSAGSGRVRLEANSWIGFQETLPRASISTPSQLLPDATTPSIRPVSVTIGGQTYPVPADPRASFSFPQADVIAAAGGAAVVALEARNVAPGRTCQVRVASPTRVGATWITSSPLSGTLAQSSANASVSLSIGLHALQVRVVL